jgi:UDP-glucose 4-epimerase
MTLEEHRVLITGGAGFVGSGIARTLVDSGATVDIVDNLFAGRRELVPEDATFHEHDIRSDELKETLQTCRPTAIFHLAAIHSIPYCTEHPEAAFEVNAMGTRMLFDAARELDTLEQVVYASTAAVYPPRDEAHIEDTDPAPIDVYGRTKLIGEDHARLFHADTGVPTVSARLFNIFGPNDTNDHLIPAIVEQLRNGTSAIELGNLTPERDFVYKGDVVRALTKILLEFDGSYRTYNVGTGTAYSVSEVVECIGDALNEDIEIIQDESRTRTNDRAKLQADPARIRQEIGWQPQTEFVDGLQSLLKSEGLIE